MRNCYRCSHYVYYKTVKEDAHPPEKIKDLYYGPDYSFTIDDIIGTADKYGGVVTEATNEDVVNLITLRILLSPR